MDEDEREVMACLVAAWNKFASMKSTHPDHIDDFRRGIHACQSVIMHRIVQHDYPQDFPIYGDDDG